MKASTPRIIMPACAHAASGQTVAPQMAAGDGGVERPLGDWNCRKVTGIYAVHGADSLDRGQELPPELKCLLPARPEHAKKLQNSDNQRP
jgi:hypothetical protein